MHSIASLHRYIAVPVGDHLLELSIHKTSFESVHVVDMGEPLTLRDDDIISTCNHCPNLAQFAYRNLQKQFKSVSVSQH